jgi:hypothetical protein
VVRIVVTQGLSRSYGTGTLVATAAERAWVLTCAHLFRGSSDPVAVVFPDGRRVSAQLVTLDRTWDLGLVALPAVPISPVVISPEIPRPGEWLTACGYGPDGVFRCVRGQLRGFVRSTGTSSYEMLSLGGSARQGDSGGPVFNAQGQLVGVLWGSDGQTIVATYCGRIRAFLAQWLPQAPRGEPVAEPSTPPPPSPSPPAAVSQQLAQLADRLARLEQQLGTSAPAPDRPATSLSERLAQLEAVTAQLPELRRRVADAEQSLGTDNLRAVIRDVALGVLAERAPSLVEHLLTRLAEALGWSTPPSLALVLAARLIGRRIARRAARRRSQLRQQATASSQLTAASAHCTTDESGK